jgi:ATP-dependent helicase/nuclease subunit B
MAVRTPRLVVTGYGRAALDELATTVRTAKGNDPLAPITVIVPNNGVGVAARRALARDGRGIGAVTFTTVSRLAEQLGRARLSAEGRRPASGVLVLGTLRRELDRNAGVFAPVASHRATEDALVRVHRELIGLSAPGLARLAAMSARAADVVRLHRRTRATLAAPRRAGGPGWFDEGDLFDAATDELRASASPATALGRCVVFLPQALSSRANSFLAALANRVQTDVIVALAGEPSADADINGVLDALGLPMPLALAPAAPPLTIRSVADPDDEVRHAVRDLVTAAKNNVPLDRCALVYASADPYARIVADALDASKLPWHGPSARGLADTVAGRTLLGAIELAGATGQARFDRVRLFGFLAAAPMQTVNGRWVPVAAWERVSRQAGVLAGADHFRLRLQSFITRNTTRVEAMNDEYSGSVPALQRSMQAARDLLAEVNDLDERFNALNASTTWSETAGLLNRLMLRLLGADRERESWPLAEKRAADAVDEVLSELAQLDVLDLPVDLVTFGRLAAHALDARAFRHGRLGEGVLVGPLDEVIGHDLELVVVLGAAEGLLPAPIGDDPLLPDRERTASGELATSARIAARQHRAFVAATRSAATTIVSWPRGDLRQNVERNPSRWLPLDEPTTTHEHVASFAASLKTLTVPATESEARLRAITAGRQPADASYLAGKAAVDARIGRVMTEYDGDLSTATAADVSSPTIAHTSIDLSQPISPSRLQAWATCPFAYFMHFVLGVEPVEDPAVELTINALDRGNLVHAVLERFVSDGMGAPVSWDSRSEVARLDEDFAALAGEAAETGRVGRQLYWRRGAEELRTRLHDFIARDHQRLIETHAEPAGTEVPFGRAGKPTADIELADGRVVRFTGMIDRVDVTKFGHVVVTDYKSGKPDRYAKLSPETPTLGGAFLQLPIYAIAAQDQFGPTDREPRPVDSSYRFVEQGVDKGYTVDNEVLARVIAHLTVIVDGISGGLFPSRPETGGGNYIPCRYCDPDGFGTAELHRWWTEKRHDPRLAAYREMVGIALDEASTDTADTDDGTAS